VSNVLNEEKQKQVLALGQLGWSLRRIEAATGIRRETAASYLRAAGVALRQPGGWGRKPKPATDLADSSPAEAPKPAIADREVTTETEPDPEPDPEPETPRTESACEPHREQIEAALARGRNAMSIWQTLVDQHGFAGAYESVKRFVRKLRGQPSLEACAIIETAPGEEAQVDYGTGPMVHDPDTGKHRRTRLFVLTLGFSRKCVRLLTFQSSTRIWCELHQEAFRRLGGTPRLVVLDNLGEGVLKPDIYDPAINPLYRDLLQHYGVVAMPCRVRDPDRKGKVESGVGHAQKTPLKGMRFDRDLAEAQSYLDQWEERWADTRIHGTTKRKWPSCLLKRSRRCACCRSSHSGSINTSNDAFISMVAWKWKRLTIAFRRATSDAKCRCRSAGAMERPLCPHSASAHGATVARALAAAARPAADRGGRPIPAYRARRAEAARSSGASGRTHRRSLRRAACPAGRSGRPAHPRHVVAFGSFWGRF